MLKWKLTQTLMQKHATTCDCDCHEISALEKFFRVNIISNNLLMSMVSTSRASMLAITPFQAEVFSDDLNN